MIGKEPKNKKWIKSSEIVDAGTKVYGFRVDNVHNETYRMWNGFMRNAVGDQNIEIIEERGEDEED